MTEPELDALVKRLENVSLQVGFPSRTILDSAVIRQAIDTITTLRAQLAEARAERKKALREAASITRPDVSRRYCTNDEAFFNEGFAAAVNTILAMIEQPEIGSGGKP